MASPRDVIGKVAVPWMTDDSTNWPKRSVDPCPGGDSWGSSRRGLLWDGDPSLRRPRWRQRTTGARGAISGKETVRAGTKMRFAIARLGRTAFNARSSATPAAGTTPIPSIAAASIATRPTPVHCHFARGVHLIPKMVSCAHRFRRQIRSVAATASRTRTVRPSKTACASGPAGNGAPIIRGAVARSRRRVPPTAPAAAREGASPAFRPISARRRPVVATATTPGTVQRSKTASA